MSVASEPASGTISRTGTRPRQRLIDIQRAKGLAIILVVFGHLVATGTPPGNEWYGQVRYAIYSFHMPFFMYLSGYVFFLASYNLKTENNYGRFALSRAERLLLPFIIFGVAIVLGKYLFRYVGHVDDPPTSLFDGLRHLFLDTSRSPAGSIWYIYVLFIYSIATPLLWHFARGRWRILLLVAALMVLIPADDDFYLDRVLLYYIFFLAGGFSVTHQDSIAPFMKRNFGWLALLFAASFCLLALDAPRQWQLIAIGLCSLWPLHQLMRSQWVANDRFLAWLGDASFIIYLLNTILIGLAKAAFLKVLPFRDEYFLLAVPILFTAGLFGPIVLQALVISRIPYFGKLLR